MKKILSLVIVCTMVLGMLSLVSFADEQTMTIVPYEKGFENWTGGTGGTQTQLLIAPKDAAGNKIAAAYTDTEAVWTITLTPAEGEAKTINLKQSSQYDGGTWGLIRFEPCLAEGDNYFAPVKDMTYTIEVSFTSGGTTYKGVSDENAFKMPVDPVTDDYVAPTTIGPDLTIAPRFDIIENWGGKTYFITGVTSTDNSLLYKNVNPENATTWKIKLTVADETANKTYTIDEYKFDKPGSEIYGTDFFRFALVEYGVTVDPTHSYTVKVEVVVDGEVMASGVSATGAFTSQQTVFLADGPIVPEEIPHTSTVVDGIFPAPVDPDPTPDPTPDTPVEPETVTLDVAPIFDVIENWSGKTYIIWQLPTAEDAVKEDLHAKLKDGTYKMKYVITDTTAEKTYIIEEYFFDVGGEFGDWAGWYRLAAGHYGITLEADHAYTLEFSVTEGETELYNGKSEAGAFVSKQAGFIADGAITPDEVPHSYTEPTTPPVTPPETGDATVYAIVFAVVAILGMAVVVTKKVNA